SCPSNIVANVDASLCSAVVTYSAPVGTDSCVGAVTTQTGGLASGSAFPVGVITNVFLVTDAAGNTATCSFTVTVNDSEPPVISCPAPTSASADAGCQAAVPNVLSGVTASDNCSGTNGITFSQSPAAGTQVGLGAHTITVTATDEAGNSATCTTTFTVEAQIS